MKRDWAPLFAAISTSEKLASLSSDSHRLFYTWLIPQCDAWGRVEASPRVLNAKVWPMLTRSVSETDSAIRDCERLGLLEVREADGILWVQVPDWDQKAGTIGQLARDRGTSKFPPQGKPRLTLGQACEGSESPQAKPAQRRAEESRGEEKKREPRAPRAAAAPLPHEGPDVKHEDRQKFIGFWLTQFEKSTGRPYGPIGAKDAGQVTQILRLARGDVSEACSRTMILLNAAPDWIGRGGVDLGSLLTHWNKLVSAGQVGILTGAKALAIASVNAPVAPLPGLLDYRKKPAPLGIAQ